MVSSVPFPSSFRHPSTIPLDSQIFFFFLLFFFPFFLLLLHTHPLRSFLFYPWNARTGDSFPVDPSRKQVGTNYNSVVDVSTTSITTSKGEWGGVSAENIEILFANNVGRLWDDRHPLAPDEFPRPFERYFPRPRREEKRNVFTILRQIGRILFPSLSFLFPLNFAFRHPPFAYLPRLISPRPTDYIASFLLFLLLFFLYFLFFLSSSFLGNIFADLSV